VTWKGTLRVLPLDDAGKRYITYSTRYQFCPQRGCDHTIEADTRSKAERLAIKEHLAGCLQRQEQK